MIKKWILLSQSLTWYLFDVLCKLGTATSSGGILRWLISYIILSGMVLFAEPTGLVGSCNNHQLTTAFPYSMSQPSSMNLIRRLNYVPLICKIRNKASVTDSERKDQIIEYPRQIDQTLVNADTNDPAAQPTYSIEGQVNLEIDFTKLEPCIGKGATGSIRVYRDYFDGNVTHSQIAIKFMEIRKSYEQALKEVQIYQKLEPLQGKCIPTMFFHGPMYPFYIIGMTFIEGQHFSEHDYDNMAPALSDCLNQIHKCGVVHNDFYSGNILIDKFGKPWIIDLANAYFEPDMSIEKMNAIENILSLKSHGPENDHE